MIEINGEAWRLVFVSYNHPILIRSNGSKTIGVCDDKSKTIYIEKGLHPTLVKKVLCHELTHAAMFSYNIELNMEQEELLADLIATYGQEIILMTNKIFCRLKHKNKGYGS